MKEKINYVSVAVYTKAKECVENFKNDERGLSGVVVAVMLILVAVLAVSFLSESVNTLIKDLWERIMGEGKVEGINS